jgi:hypothetical protein
VQRKYQTTRFNAAGAVVTAPVRTNELQLRNGVQWPGVQDAGLDIAAGTGRNSLADCRPAMWRPTMAGCKLLIFKRNGLPAR